VVLVIGADQPWHILLKITGVP